MDKAKFDEVVATITVAYATLCELPLDEFVRDLQRDAAFGCFMDSPMLWSDRREICDRLFAMATAAQAFVAKGATTLEQAHRELAKQAAKAEKPSS